MLTSIIILIIVGLVLFLVYWLLAKVVPQPFETIIGVILALVFLLYTLHTFRVVSL